MKIIIIGGSHAGISCAKRAIEEYPDSEIVIYERKSEISFVSQSIPQYLMGKNNLLNHSTYTNVRELEAIGGIYVKTRTTIQNINTSTKQITYIEKESDELPIDHYDKLVVATGSYPIIPPIRGAINENLFFVKNKQDAITINDFMKKKKSIAIMGGGMIGVELSRIFRRKGLEVHLIQAGDRLLNKYVDEEVGEQIRILLEDEGIKIYPSSLVLDIKENVNSKHASKEQTAIIYMENGSLEVDGIVSAIGFRPNSILLKDQVLLGDMGAIEVDEYMRTSVDDVFAVGDCATTYVRRRNKKVYLPHASDAFREGAVAAVNLVENKLPITSSQGTYSMNLENYSICVTGLTHEIATSEGYMAKTAYFENQFLNTDEYLKMWLVYEQGSHKILGIQAMGTAPNLSNYANIISVAIQQELTVEDLEFTDFYFEQGYKNPDGFMKIMAQIIREQANKKGA